MAFWVQTISLHGQCLRRWDQAPKEGDGVQSECFHKIDVPTGSSVSSSGNFRSQDFHPQGPSPEFSRRDERVDRGAQR